MRLRGLSIALISLPVAALVMAIGGSQENTSWNDPVVQWAKAIKFSHKLHQELGAECSACHAKVTASTQASDLLLPEHAECSACHDVETETECKLCHVDPENLVGFEAVEREVKFNHKSHADSLKIECSVCHAGVEKAELPSTAFLPSMATCHTCHNDVKASNACENCHTRVETLLPLSHQTVDWREQHKRLARTEAPQNNCAMCHSENFCQTCHADATTQVTSGGLQRSVPENRPAPSGKDPLVKQKVHVLNYVFTHGLDFRTRQSDCSSCHDQQAFCADCHQRDQDAGFASPVPLSHSLTGFVRVGVGSGGGNHAELARQDIESCASCHDLEGGDPNCLTCHVDRTPGRGNDPKTHPADFRTDDDGDWHSNDGSLCYNCHTNTRQAGVGFCGYCHGMK